jgi:hypothetical protein
MSQAITGGGMMSAKAFRPQRAGVIAIAQFPFADRGHQLTIRADPTTPQLVVNRTECGGAFGLRFSSPVKGSQRNSHGRPWPLPKILRLCENRGIESVQLHIADIASRLWRHAKRKPPFSGRHFQPSRVLVRRIIPQPRPSAPTHGPFPQFLVFFIYVEVTVIG